MEKGCVSDLMQPFLFLQFGEPSLCSFGYMVYT